MKKSRASRRITQFLLLWHKQLGLIAAVFVLLLSITGIALNHTSAFKLNDIYISSDWVLDHYHIAEPSTLTYYPLSEANIYQADDLLIINENIITPIQQAVIGAVSHGSFIIVALKSKLLLIEDKLHIVAIFDQNDGVPTQITRIGRSTDQQLVFETEGKLVTVDESFSQWSSFEQKRTTWSIPRTVDKALKEELNQRYRAHIIQLETLILDLHSGRFFGQYGVLFFDFIAILLIFLAISGVFVWFKLNHPSKP